MAALDGALAGQSPRDAEPAGAEPDASPVARRPLRLGVPAAASPASSVDNAAGLFALLAAAGVASRVETPTRTFRFAAHQPVRRRQVAAAVDASRRGVRRTCDRPRRPSCVRPRARQRREGRRAGASRGKPGRSSGDDGPSHPPSRRAVRLGVPRPAPALALRWLERES